LHIKTTWFVRADNQLKDVYGTAAYLLDKYADLWEQMELTGDEIGWHPHVYEWSEAERLYVPDLDVTRRSEKLRQIREELIEQGYAHTSARIGEAFHTNESMKILELLSLRTDATAIPGRKKTDASRWFDWSITRMSHYPSKSIIEYQTQNRTWKSLKFHDYALSNQLRSSTVFSILEPGLSA
jgi:hypothetical protein